MHTPCWLIYQACIQPADFEADISLPAVDAGSPAFLDPAIITSSSAAGLPAQMVPSSLQGTVRRPPGFGGSIAQQQRQPLFARGGDWHGQGRYGETQHRHVSTDSAEYSSWEQR